MNTSLSPTLASTSLQGHSGNNHMELAFISGLHSSMVLHAASVFEVHKLLFEIYRIAGQFTRQSQYSRQMSHQREPCSSPGEMADGGNDPDPPAAPPIIILAQSGKVPAPHFQVPGPADLQVRPHPSTSSLSPQTSPRELQPTDALSRPPSKPAPEPHPAPPVIILSDKDHPSASPPRAPTSSPTPTSARPPTTPRNPQTMGSKVSKLKESASDGKLQPSQERMDKEQMKEPSNYYSHRSKSMRRKAGKGGASAEAGGAAGGAGGGGLP